VRVADDRGGHGGVAGDECDRHLNQRYPGLVGECGEGLGSVELGGIEVDVLPTCLRYGLGVSTSARLPWEGHCLPDGRELLFLAVTAPSLRYSCETDRVSA
jgi:hypothetical protein